MNNRKKQKSGSPAQVLGILSTSSPAQNKDIKKGLSFLNKKKINYFFPEENQRLASTAESVERPYLASSDLSKIKALETLAQNSSIHNILAVRGGYGSLRLLKHLTPHLLKKLKDKKIWGFSDLTSLQNALFSINGQPWVHSPMLFSDAFNQPQGLERQIWNRIFETVNRDSQKIQKYSVKHFRTELFSQIPSLKNTLLIGGNLACFAALCGTGKFFKIPKQKIFIFLEDISEKPHRIDRLLTQLQLSGIFQNCSALILGHFTECGDFLPIFKKWSIENKIPLFFDLKVGHERPNLPLAMGVKATIVKKSSKHFELRVPIFGLK
jgi:muramoyltetrapeptide carboxypeptidase